MSFLPYQRIQINTHLNNQEVYKRLESVVQAERTWGVFQKGEKPYEGVVKDTYFEISPAITYRNPGKPIIKGNIQAEANGCSIRLSIQLPILTILLMIMFIFVVGMLGLISFFVSYLFSDQGTSITNSSLLWFLGVSFFIYVMVLGGFIAEADKSKLFFCELFETKKIIDL